MPERLECDVAVIGGGPAGVAAACTAADRGVRVVLLENTPWLGGPVWRASDRRAVARRGRQWLTRLERSTVQVLTETTAVACEMAEQGTGLSLVIAEQQGGSVEVAFRNLVIAVGAQELLLPFPGWTLPNVFGLGGLQLLAKSGWPVRGKRVVVAGSGPLLLAVAAALVRRGAHVTDILEQAPRRNLLRFAVRLPWLAPSKIVQALGFQRSLFGVRYRAGCWPVAAHGSARLQSVTFTNGSTQWVRECDYLACGFALVPGLQWPRMLGCRIDRQAVQVDQWQQTSVPDVYTAGESTGISGVDGAVVEGQIAGYAAAGGRTESEISQLMAHRRRSQRFAAALQSAFRLREELKDLPDDATMVCRCEDVTWSQLRAQNDVRSAKLLSRCGMGPCQGRVCHNALRWLKSWESDHVRPPVLPVTVGALAANQNRQRKS